MDATIKTMLDTLSPKAPDAAIDAAREELDAAVEAYEAADRYYHREQPRDVPNENKIAALRYSLRCEKQMEQAYQTWLALVDPDANEDRY